MVRHGSLARRRVRGTKAGAVGHGRCGRIVQAPAPPFRSGLSVPRVVGLVSNGVPGSPDEIAAVGVAIAPLGGWFETRGPIARRSGARAQSDIRVTRSVHGERLASSHVPRFRFHIGASSRAASRVVRHVVALSGVLFEEGSFDGPSNKRMEPSRPMVLCDPVTAPRGSFAALAGPLLVERRISRRSLCLEWFHTPEAIDGLTAFGLRR